MASLVPIAITILRCADQYLFIRRRKPPYENLWSLVGGKVNLGEHIHDAAVREVMEETGATGVRNFESRGMVSERLVTSNQELSAHFLIFVGYAEIDNFKDSHREGDLKLFTLDEIIGKDVDFLPSDWHMFQSFNVAGGWSGMYEAELLHDGAQYHLNYYRKAVA
ncbi:MAG: NUDIX domain-containing protein [Candidatus Thorarchaeota archaeon]